MSLIILDPHHLRLLPADALEVIDAASYLAARQHLLHTLRFPAEAARPIVVRQGPWQYWFADVPEWVQTLAPRAELLGRYPAAVVPPALTDAAVLALDLLHLPGIIPTAEGLRQHFMPGLPLPVPSTPTAAELFQLAQFAHANAERLAIPYLRGQWKAMLDALPPALAPLQAADASFAGVLAEGIYLSGLPAAAEEWAHEHRADLLKKYGIVMADLVPLLSWTVPPTAPTTNAAWEQRLQKTIEAELRALPAPLRPLKQLDLLPGYYRAELLALLALAPSLDTDTLVKLESHYATVLAADYTGSLRERLQALVPPSLVPAPTPRELATLSLPAQYQRWQQWATTSFIPYKFWLDQLPDHTEEQLTAVEKPATEYGDWLFNNYASLLSHSSISTNRSVRSQIADLLTAPGSRVLWLIIDGFPVAYLPLLREALALHGINQVHIDYILAPLPTITEIGMPALLNGLRPDDPAFIPHPNYTDALERAFLGHSVAQSSAVGKFQQKMTADTDLCCLHWWELDQFLHKPQHHIKGTRTEYIRRKLHEYIGEMADELRRIPSRKTRLVISTDHGATRCLRNKSGISNHKINEASTAKHERCVKLEGKLLNEKEHLDAEETYFLPPALTHNPNPWVIARGYRYFGSNDHGYRHGGLTPEETIIPLVVAEIGAFVLKPLRLTYLETRPLVLGNTLTNAAFLIQNPNDFAVELTGIRLSEDPKASTELVVELTASAKLPVKLTFKLPRSMPVSQGQVTITVALSYNVQGESHTNRLPISIMLPTSELDDAFGDL
jgi:hypothetical protein